MKAASTMLRLCAVCFQRPSLGQASTLLFFINPLFFDFWNKEWPGPSLGPVFRFLDLVFA